MEMRNFGFNALIADVRDDQWNAANVRIHRCGRSAELVENMIAKERQRTGEHAVERFHRSEKSRMTGDPRLGGTGRNCHADSKTLLQHKPGSKGAHQCRTAMIDDGKFALGKPRWIWPRLQRRSA